MEADTRTIVTSGASVTITWSTLPISPGAVSGEGWDRSPHETEVEWLRHRHCVTTQRAGKSNERSGTNPGQPVAIQAPSRRTMRIHYVFDRCNASQRTELLTSACGVGSAASSE
jgi:hypothetical protein